MSEHSEDSSAAQLIELSSNHYEYSTEIVEEAEHSKTESKSPSVAEFALLLQFLLQAQIKELLFPPTIQESPTDLVHPEFTNIFYYCKFGDGSPNNPEIVIQPSILHYDALIDVMDEAEINHTTKVFQNRWNNLTHHMQSPLLSLLDEIQISQKNRRRYKELCQSCFLNGKISPSDSEFVVRKFCSDALTYLRICEETHRICSFSGAFVHKSDILCAALLYAEIAISKEDEKVVEFNISDKATLSPHELKYEDDSSLTHENPVDTEDEPIPREEKNEAEKEKEQEKSKDALYGSILALIAISLAYVLIINTWQTTSTSAFHKLIARHSEILDGYVHESLQNAQQNVMIVVKSIQCK